MGMRVSLDISDERLASMKELVASGEYASLDAIVEHALRLWSLSTHPEIERIRERISEADAGSFEPWEGGEAILARARAEYEATKHSPHRAA